MSDINNEKTADEKRKAIAERLSRGAIDGQNNIIEGGSKMNVNTDELESFFYKYFGVEREDDASKRRKILAEKLKRGEQIRVTPTGHPILVLRKRLERLSFHWYELGEYLEKLSNDNEKLQCANDCKTIATKIALQLRYGNTLRLDIGIDTDEDLFDNWQEIADIWKSLAYTSPTHNIDDSMNVQERNISEDNTNGVINIENKQESKSLNKYLDKIYADSFPEGDILLSELLKASKISGDSHRESQHNKIPDGVIAGEKYMRYNNDMDR